ncbi:hypothetical protein ACFOEE_06465 [Pseudoalteromonas fenneropenaei]|uniref:Uncharacterized protein n=1 Tax=Pseudoalteromonas fenneropenaei TaxID=1737459 RepID=A0ABV7CHY6_9GAMM
MLYSINLKAEYFIWKVIFLVQVLVVLFSTFENQALVDVGRWGLLIGNVLGVFDGLVFAANLLLILKVRALSEIVWLVVAWVWWLLSVVQLMYEFYLGGYTTSEMLFMVNIVWFLIIFSLPVFRYAKFLSEPNKVNV